MKILIDTNVLISALVFQGSTRELIKKLMDSSHKILVSTYIRKEFEEKISEKWVEQKSQIMKKFDEINFDIRESADEVTAVLRDAKDDPILADARYFDVDILLTGDKDFLEAEIDHPQIYSPKMLLEKLQELDMKSKE